MRPHRQQPTRLLCPWDSPGKNTGVGCHFLLQCIKVKSESEVTQSCPTLSDPKDWSLQGSSVHGIFQARVLEWGAIAFSEILHSALLKTSKITYWSTSVTVNFSVSLSLCMFSSNVWGFLVRITIQNKQNEGQQGGWSTDTRLQLGRTSKTYAKRATSHTRSHIHDSISITYIGKSRDTESRFVVARDTGSGEYTCLLGIKFPFEGDENVLQLDEEDDCPTPWVY